MAVNEKVVHGGGLAPVVVGEVHSPAEGEAVYRQCLLSFPDSSLQYSSCDPVCITQFGITTDTVGCTFSVQPASKYVWNSNY